MACSRTRKAYALLTLVLGAWITHGRHSEVRVGVRSVHAQSQLLIDTGKAIVRQ